MRTRASELIGVHEEPLLGPAAQDAYARMRCGELMDAAQPGVGRLIELHLAVQTAGDDGLYTALSPRSAAQNLRLHAMDTVQRATDNARELMAFTDLLEEEVPAAPPQPEPAARARLVAGFAAIDGELEELVSAAKHSISTAHPGATRPQLLASTRNSRDNRAIARGVKYRTIYESRARTSRPAHTFAERVSVNGGAVRHTAHPFTRIMIFDGHTALVPASRTVLPPEAREDVGPLAWIITDAGGVDFISQQFELLWASACPWTTDHRPSPITSRLHRQILRGLLGGDTQKGVAAKLGISANWASQQLNELIKRLDLRTRDQLIAWWVDSAERHLDD